MGIAKFSIWLDIPSRNIKDFYAIVSVIACGYVFQKINWHILSGFFPLIFGISLLVDKKLMQIMSNWIVFFSRTSLHFFDLCHICLLSAI